MSDVFTYSSCVTGTFHYLWGLDLSGTLQGAGGVGGLLAVVKDDTPSAVVASRQTIDFQKRWNNSATLCADQLCKNYDLRRIFRTAAHETTHNVGWGNHYLHETEGKSHEENVKSPLSNTLVNKPNLDSRPNQDYWKIPSGND